MIVDIGLPDGSGIPLIEALAHGSPRIEVILGISGTLPRSRCPKGRCQWFFGKPIANRSQRFNLPS